MPIEILMPALSPTMTEGTLSRWLKHEGDAVKSGDALAEIETDKATMEVEAVDEGVIGRLLVPEGTENVAVNRPIALLLEEGEDPTALPKVASGEAPLKPAPAKAEPAPAPAAGKTAAPAPAPARSPAPAPQKAEGDRVFASPLARRIAAEAGLDLGAIAGSGPNGRIVRADVEAAKAGGAPRKAPAPAAAAGPRPAAGPVTIGAGVDARDYADKLGMKYQVVPNSGVRRTIARRLTEAAQTIPHFTLTVDCEIDRLLALRGEVAEQAGVKLSVNDFVIKASALALRKVPKANASWHEDGILLYEAADVSVAVATDGGLITPIIKSADTKSVAQISAEMKDLGIRARQGKLKPEEYQGGTFSVSNLGMYGIRSFTSIINPPQGCILSVGAGEKRPVVRGDALAVATLMTLTLSCDHRVVDGALGAELLGALKKLIESPLQILV
jgi:pyruvate dehydrogenase E2 component (dihydrolipoamide acetyltransferase)